MRKDQSVSHAFNPSPYRQILLTPPSPASDVPGPSQPPNRGLAHCSGEPVEWMLNPMPRPVPTAHPRPGSSRSNTEGVVCQLFYQHQAIA
ncbi:uncharacterized protein BO88DRAFT_249352 [Aspergillus vadensis CBS 113365]|uniref:Uncharacterized protein n=1 Tax=Aspergillus vadensis (strain CBS 113365 / IMI 142717 / IBT 24658) TaxID=1448311 RepID=A0A319CSV4_ASPVC|nr:hypothetical protein BO88DRAFT_249352 [Aspergillus vadensis CBS 113365]PYH71342.1 hypothetical protein BO88DRAFT_249352 [Aspergillus vadensis CBS 113365]